MAKFCSECGSALEANERFCTSCGHAAAAPAAPIAPASPAIAPTAPAVAPAARRAGGSALTLPLIVGGLAAVAGYALLALTPLAAGILLVVVALVVAIARAVLGLVFGLFFRRGLVVALATVLVMGSCGYAASAYAQGPDFRGLSVPSQRELAKFLPFLRPSGTMPPKDAELDRLRKAATAASRQAAAAASAQIAAIKQKLVAARLPVVALSRERTESGEAVLAVGLDFERLAGPLSATGGVVETFGSMVRIAQIKDLDLRGLQHVSVGVLDGSRRLIFSMAAPVAAIEGFRAGTLKQDKFIASLAFRGENRLAMIDAVRRMVAK